MLDGERPGSVMHGAIAITVVANRAVQQVIAEDAIKGFALGGISPGRGRRNGHAVDKLGRASANQLSVDLDHAGVAGLNGAKLVVVTDLGKLDADSVDQIDQPFSRYKLPNNTVDTDAWHEIRIHRNSQHF
jgi:hypothetical protein